MNLMDDNTNNACKLRALPNEQKAAQLIIARPPPGAAVTLINLNNVDIARESN